MCLLCVRLFFVFCFLLFGFLRFFFCAACSFLFHFQGKEYIFISNVDNLGATVDLDMLYHIFDQEAEFAVEAIERTRADLSGGLVVGYGGKPKVVELSTVPTERRDQFVKKFNLFNTNNM